MCRERSITADLDHEWTSCRTVLVLLTSQQLDAQDAQGWEDEGDSALNDADSDEPEEEVHVRPSKSRKRQRLQVEHRSTDLGTSLLLVHERGVYLAVFNMSCTCGQLLS